MALRDIGGVRLRSRVVNVSGEQADQAVQLSPGGELIVTEALPYAAELTRLGDSWYVMTSTAAVPVLALPTTQTGMLTIWNNEPVGQNAQGKAYVIDSLMAMIVTGTTAATHLGMYVMMSKGVKTTLTTTITALTPGSMSGRTYAGNAQFATSTTGLTNDGWMPWGVPMLLGAVNTGAGANFPVDGKLIIRPGGQFTICATANTTTTITALVGLHWHEVYLPVA